MSPILTGCSKRAASCQAEFRKYLDKQINASEYEECFVVGKENVTKEYLRHENKKRKRKRNE